MRRHPGAIPDDHGVPAREVRAAHGLADDVRRRYDDAEAAAGVHLSAVSVRRCDAVPARHARQLDKRIAHISSCSPVAPGSLTTRRVTPASFAVFPAVMHECPAFGRVTPCLPR